MHTIRPTAAMAFLSTTVLLLVIVSCTAAATAAAHPVITYDPSLVLLLDGLNFADMTPEATDTGRGTFHLTMFDGPSDRNTDAYAQVVVSLVPLCLAANKANVSELTLFTLGNVLLGLTNSAYRVALGSVVASPSSKQLLRCLFDRGVTGFDSFTDWPDRVKANANIVWVASDAALSAYVASHDGVIGPQAAVLTTAAAVECLKIRMTSTNGDSLAFSPVSMVTSKGTQAATLEPEEAHVFTQGMTYPLVGGLVLTAPVNTTCVEMETLRQMLLFFFTNASQSLQSRGVSAADIELQVETLVTLPKLISTACPTNGLAFRTAGDLTMYDAVAAIMLASLGSPLVDFNGHVGIPNNTAVLEMLRDTGAPFTIAFLDTPAPAIVKAMHDEVLVAPLLSVALAVTYNIDGTDSLAASPCTMLGLLNGTILYWDDPQVVRDNVGTVIPHLQVTRMVSPSTTMTSLIRGLNVLYTQCSGTATEPFDVSSATWPFFVDQEVVYADAHTILQQVSGALCLLPAPVSARFGLQMLAFRAAIGVTLLPSDATANIVMDNGHLDTQTNVVVMPSHGASLYPFVAALHVAVRASYSGDCTKVNAAMEFLDLLMSSDGQTVVDITGYTLFPALWRAVPLQTIRQVTCDGAYVFASAGSSAFSTASEVGIIVGCLVVVAAVGGLLAARLGDARSHSNAPKDETKPFAVVFTDIQASTALWAAVPSEMGPALDQHHAVIREAIAASDGYEVKTIGDSFMVAFKTARAAVSFAVLVQKMLHARTWAPVFDEFYFNDARACNEPPQREPSLWNGLRVRVGVHYGTGQIKFDAVMNAYNYYGTVVNTAARVEAVGHGGQVCVTSAALEAATADGDIDSVVMTDLGPQELRGLNEPLHLIQLVPRELSNRVFPPLRLHKAGHEDVVLFSTSHDQDPGRSVNSASGELRSATSSNAGQDDIGNFFASAAHLSQGRLHAEDLLSQFQYTKVLLAAASGGGNVKKQKGRSGALVASNVVKQCCELWRIGREAEGSYEERVLKAYGTEMLQLCKLVVRVAGAASSKHTPHRSSVGSPDAGGQTRGRSSWSSATKYSSLNDDGCRPGIERDEEVLPGQRSLDEA